MGQKHPNHIGNLIRHRLQIVSKALIVLWIGHYRNQFGFLGLRFSKLLLIVIKLGVVRLLLFLIKLGVVRLLLSLAKVLALRSSVWFYRSALFSVKNIHWQRCMQIVYVFYLAGSLCVLIVLWKRIFSYLYEIDDNKNDNEHAGVGAEKTEVEEIEAEVEAKDFPIVVKALNKPLTSYFYVLLFLWIGNKCGTRIGSYFSLAMCTFAVILYSDYLKFFVHIIEFFCDYAYCHFSFFCFNRVGWTRLVLILYLLLLGSLFLGLIGLCFYLWKALFLRQPKAGPDKNSSEPRTGNRIMSLISYSSNMNMYEYGGIPMRKKHSDQVFETIRNDFLIVFKAVMVLGLGNLLARYLGVLVYQVSIHFYKWPALFQDKTKIAIFYFILSPLVKILCFSIFVILVFILIGLCLCLRKALFLGSLRAGRTEISTRREGVM